MTNSSTNHNTMLNRQVIFNVAAILALISAAYHFIGIVYPIDFSPPWRHTLFVFVNIACYYGFVHRPKFFVFLFLGLVVQQFYTHGGPFLQEWTNDQTINWMDLLVLLLLPVFLISLILDYTVEKKMTKANK